MRRVTFIIAWLMCVCLLFGPDVVASETIRISAIEYPPLFQSTFVPGLGYGIVRDLTTEAFNAVDTEVTFEFLPVARSVWSVIEKKYPATLGSITWFAKDQQEHLVEPINFLHVNVLLFYKKARFPEGIVYDNLSELQQYTIGNTRGSATTPIVEQAQLRIEWVPESELNFKKLHTDRLDFAIAAEIAGWAVIRDLFPDSVNDFGTVRKPLLPPAPVGVVFHKDETALIARFKQGVDIILENGTYSEILERYYGDDHISNDVLPPYIKENIKKK